MTIQLILMIGVLLFACSSAFFIIQPKKHFNSPLLVSLTTLISYILMFEGSFLLEGSDSSAHWTRWVFYGISCPLLAYEIGRQLGFDIEKNIKNLFLVVLVMMTGALASIYTGLYMWIFFFISSIAYTLFVYDIFSSNSENKLKISPYVIFGWTAFPLVFIFSPEGLDLIPGIVAVAIYLFLDLFTKIVFYLTTNSKSDWK